MTDTGKPLSAEKLSRLRADMNRKPNDYSYLAFDLVATIADLEARLVEANKRAHCAEEDAQYKGERIGHWVKKLELAEARAEKAEAALSTERAAGYRAGMVRAAGILRCLGLSYSAKFVIAESEKPEGKEG